MRLWIDECLSPTLVAVAQAGYEATCNEYRGMLHATDLDLYAVLSDEQWVFVTNNEADFRALARHAGIHPGLIVMPQRTRAEQASMLRAILDYIEQRSTAAGLSAASWMTNKLIDTTTRPTRSRHTIGRQRLKWSCWLPATRGVAEAPFLRSTRVPRPRSWSRP